MNAAQNPTKHSGRQYKMTVAGQLFKHLGLQMYSGAVPAISELISNAYDAMARNVWITIPTGHSLTQNDLIEVSDDGHGMSFEDCNSRYLLVGSDRRLRHSEWTDEYNGLPSRKVQGRKGIGKLAGFGIANLITVRSVKNRQVAHFSLDYDVLTRSSEFADKKGYTPDSMWDDGGRTEEVSGTTIQLSRLKLSRYINEDDFKSGRPENEEPNVGCF